MKSLPSRQQGFTFVEMALALFSIGFLLSAVPSLLNKGSEVMASSPGATPAEAAELALTGFVFMHHRLPCPADTPSSGTENCTLTKGFVPHRTLGLPRPSTNNEGHPFAYSLLANDAANNHLGKATAKYTPQYLVSGSDYWSTPATSTSAQINGLDFCAKLRSQSALALNTSLLNIRNWSDRTNASKMTNVAWVLVDPGSRNTDGATGSYPLFNGSNDPSSSGMSFESPSRAQTETYDDKVRVGTLNQLFGELRCPELLASVSAAAREADFANDNWRARYYLSDFRTYELIVRKQKKIQADNTEILAIFDLSMNVALAALDLGIALSGPTGAVTVAINLINAVTSISLSAYNLTQAQSGVSDAAGEVSEGETRKSDAATSLTTAGTFRTARNAALQLLDQRGWFQ
jgi:hypothetical protein